MVLIIEKNPSVHIVSCGSNVSLCGLSNPLLSSSLGCVATCKECLEKAQEIIDK